MLRIALIHNRYLKAGGEEAAFARESALLRDRGHEVVEYLEDNRCIAGMWDWELAVGTVWSRNSERRLAEFFNRVRPDVAHFHNTFPLISPAAYYAARKACVPVVQTLHNYRLLCVNALLLREGRPCEDCLGRRFAWPGVMHACYRESRAASAGVGAMITAHRWLGTWREMVDAYIALSEFARGKFVQGGLPAERVMVRPNFVADDPGTGDGSGGYGLYVGRLSPEKGIATLLTAWERLQSKILLKIAGDGPESHRVREASERLHCIEWLGPKPKECVWQLMKHASFLVCPSLCYENFPVVIAEAYAVGLPVLASDIGSLSSIVRGARTGIHFRPGDACEMAAKVDWLVTHPQELARMRQDARAEFETNYTADRSYRNLMGIYDHAMSRRLALEQANRSTV